MTTEPRLDSADEAKRPWTSATPTKQPQTGDVTVIVPAEPPVLSVAAARALLRLLVNTRDKQIAHTQSMKEGNGQS
jgi:hypothetical protein